MQRWHWGVNLPLISTLCVTLAALSLLLVGGFVGGLLTIACIVPMYLSMAAETQIPSPPDLKPWINPDTTFRINMIVSTCVGLWLIFTGISQTNSWGYASVLLGAVLIAVIMTLSRLFKKQRSKR